MQSWAYGAAAITATIKICIAACMRFGLLRCLRPLPPLQVTSVHELGVVSSSLDATIKVCDTSRCKVLHTVTAHHRGVHSFAYSRAFSLGVSGGLERDIMLWQPNTNRQIGELVGHGSSISNIIIDQRHSQVGPGSPCDLSGSQGRF